MDCVATNTSRDTCARGAGQAAAKTGETKTDATRIAVAANIRPIGLGIAPLPPRSQVAKHAKANPAPAQVQDRRRSPARSSRVLRNAATERPVFLRDFHQVDHDVLRPHIQLLIHVVDDALVKRLLLLDGPPRIQRNLDQDDIFAVMIAQIARADIEVFDWMFGDIWNLSSFGTSIASRIAL
jgi:hypothetical protein